MIAGVRSLSGVRADVPLQMLEPLEGFLTGSDRTSETAVLELIYTRAHDR